MCCNTAYFIGGFTRSEDALDLVSVTDVLIFLRFCLLR